MPKTTKPDEQNIGKKLSDLEQIVAWFENQEEVEVEKGLEKVKEGAALIKELRAKLKKVENEFEEIKAELEE